MFTVHFSAAQVDKLTQQRISSLLLGVCKSRMNRYTPEPLVSLPFVGVTGGGEDRSGSWEPLSSPCADGLGHAGHSGPAEPLTEDLPAAQRRRAAAIVKAGELQCWRAFATWLGTAIQE